MFRSITDWRTHGVDIKVELATAGDLVVGGNTTPFPFNTGGTGGAPYGWTAEEYNTAPPGNVGLYNFTTQLGVFSVSVKAAGSNKLAGALSPVFTIVPGYRYQFAVEARQMEGKALSQRNVSLAVSNNGTSFTFLTGSGTSPALADWEGILTTSAQPVAPGYTYGRIELLGTAAADLGLWGTQFQNCFIKQLDLAPAPITWRDITCDIRSLGIRYGRERQTNRYDVSSLVIELRNDEGIYTYLDPHPFGLRPGRQVRVTATFNNVTYPQAFHIIDSISEAYTIDGHVLTQWSCIDPTSVLSDSKTKSAPVGGTPLSGSRINLLADQVGYQTRLIDAGQFTQQRIVASDRSVRDEAGVTADSEGASFFADRVGNIVFKDRTWQDKDANLLNVTAQLVASPQHSDPMPAIDNWPNMPGLPLICTNAMSTDWSLARVINFVTLANAGGTAKEYRDDVSIKAHGPHTYQRLDFVNKYDSDLDTRANDLMTGYADPVLRVNTVGYVPGANNGSWPFTLGVFLNWLVRVWYQHPLNDWGYAVVTHIQSIEHRITPDDWRTSFAVDRMRSFVTYVFTDTGWDTALWDQDLWDGTPPPVEGASSWSSGDNWSNPSSIWGN